MADWLESFVGMRLHVLVRFGMWDELIAEPLPGDPELYCVTTALTHYAKGVAYAAGARVDEAQREREAAHRRGAPASPTRATCSTTPPRTSSPSRAAMLDGEIAYRSGRLRRRLGAPAARDRARRHAPLRRAVGLDAARPPRLRRAAARAGPRAGGRRGLRRRPRPGRHAAARLPAPAQRLEPARLPRGAAPPRRLRAGGARSRPALERAHGRRPTCAIHASCFCRAGAT